MNIWKGLTKPSKEVSSKVISTEILEDL